MRNRWSKPTATLFMSAYVILALATTTNAGKVTAKAIHLFPAFAKLIGPDAVQQIGVDFRDGVNSPVDRTAGASFISSDTQVADVDSTGLVIARGDGKAIVTVSWDGLEAKVPVSVRHFSRAPAMNFANQVVPVFTKLGCNSGGCHGKASGQNGFRLSLLGFEPGLDYETLVKEERGRRLFPASPWQSLLLRKATAGVPHGGGRRMEAGSHEYKVVLRWIESGMPLGRPDDPTVDRVDIYPSSRVLDRGTSQQVIVTATYTDGGTEDVTRWSQFQSNDLDVADVAENGQVRTTGHSGQAAIMARYQGKVAVFRATVPLGRAIAAKSYDFRSANLIDRLVLKQWNALGLEPSPTCTDAEFIRRARLDITGTLPSAAETRGFVTETSPDKRKSLVDRLLAHPDYATYFAIKWSDILRNKRDGKPEAAPATFRFHDWIRESLAANVPYDRFVRGVLTASGTPETAPAVMWYRKKKKTDELVDDTAQVFLGMRLQCAKCHHHPLEVWGQDDYYGFAAFFARVQRKSQVDSQRDEVIFSARTGSVTHPKTGKTMLAKGLGDRVIACGPSEDPRERLVDWMASPTNPYFAKALVNRYWAHFFGRGIAEPLDDIRLTNPPANPELFDALAESFVKSGYDMKALIRLIATSRVYGLSSVPNETNSEDRQSFARHYPRRLSAEVLLDAISQVTATPTSFLGLPAGTRAIDLPDEGVMSGFLDAFGRPKRDTACECERVSDASLGQSLMMLNSSDVQEKLSANGGRAETLSKDPRPDEVKLNELFWDAFARAPNSGESTTAMAHLAAHADKKRLAYEDILWALLNAKEFQFND